MTTAAPSRVPLSRRPRRGAPLLRRDRGGHTEDSDAFLDQFAERAVVDDVGRRFVGRAGIAARNARGNIGTRNRITVTDVRSVDAGVVLTVAVIGDGYNGGGTFVITTGSGVIERLVIRG